MSERNNNYDFEIGKLLGALCVIVALLGGYRFLVYRVYTTSPTAETITVQLPAGMVVGEATLVEAPELKAGSASVQTVEVVREKLGQERFAALLHPFGFMILLLVIIAAGGGLILLIVWLDRGVRYGRE